MRRILRKIGTAFGLLRKGEEGMVARFKAHEIGGGLDTNVLAPDDGAVQEFAEAGALAPPLAFDGLLTLLFTSNSLRQNIDAMKTNVHGFGWRPVPTLPGLMGDKRGAVVKEFEAMRGNDLTDDEAQKQADEWKKEAEQERHRMVHFFEFLNPDDTFTDLRKKLGGDFETFGNAGWEWVRDREGKPRRATYIPFVGVRLMALDPDSEEIEVPHKVDPVTIEKTKIRKRFRRYLQVQDQVAIYFKEWGDPRVLSAKTGVFYGSSTKLQQNEPGAIEATELMHFPLHAPNEVYGMPRWIGTLPEVIGSRLAAEVNVSYFENKSVPPLIMFVSGGRIAADSIGRIESFIENNIKGSENFHNILIIEAEAETEGKAVGQAKITIKPLTEAINQDALFQKYDRNNIEKVGASFRIPGMLTGSTRELNRATAEVAKALAEEQVFQPEREVFDSKINRAILPAMGIRFWAFKTRAPITRDPQVLSQIIARLVENAIMLPNEAREFIPEILGRELDPCEEDFLKRPLRLTLAMERSKGRGGNAADAATGDEGASSAPEHGNGTDLQARLARLLPMAKDAALLRQLVETIEMRDDLGSISAEDLRRMIEADGSIDVETDPVAAPRA